MVVLAAMVAAVFTSAAGAATIYACVKLDGGD